MRILNYKRIMLAGILGFAFFGLCGCGNQQSGGYTNSWLYDQSVSTVYVEMFDSKSFRRGHEYTLTDAICKRLETETPYKIVSDRNKADTLLSGQIVGIGQGVLAGDRYSGRSIEKEVIITVEVTWKNLKTGEIMVNNEQVSASSSYSDKLGQDFNYGAGVAVNRAAQRVVELMELKW